MDIEFLKEQFQNPPAEYTFAPFWFLNHELTHDELKWQINEIYNNGVKGVILHPRHGLLTDYLSEDWFDKIKTCISEAEMLGMKVWLYDENNWPSGAVDGKLTHMYPEYRMASCALVDKWQVSAGKTIKKTIDTKDGFIAAVAYPVEKDSLKAAPYSAIILDSYINENVLEWEAPEYEDKWQVFIFAKVLYRGFTFTDGYVDTLNENAIKKFIEMTHEEYTKRFKNSFGSSVLGIFTDEPYMSSFDYNHIAYTDALVSYFEYKNGYSLYSALPMLFGMESQNANQIRCDYYNTVSKLYQESFFKQIYDYCEQNKLKLIGHVLYEGEFYETTKFQGDFFKGAKYMHYGGCDMLCEITWHSKNNPHGLNNIIGPKLASSAGHLYSKDRVMCECWGLAGSWRIDIRTLKMMADWLIALGVNYLQPHAFYYSIQGFRKFECPPCEFYQSPFWKYYKIFADYCARLCNVFSNAKHIADVAVLYPTRSMWNAISPNKTEESDRIQDGFSKVTEALIKAGYDFDIIPEEELIKGRCGIDLEHFQSGEIYKALIIPPVDVLLEETCEFISEAIEHGSNVVLIGEIPQNYVMDSLKDWTDHKWNADLFSDLFSLEYDVDLFKIENRSIVECSRPSIIIPSENLRTIESLIKALKDTLQSLFRKDVIISSADNNNENISDIIHCHYRKGETDFYLISNTSKENSYHANISLDAIG
ncbi:MAG: glycosyl hydrolase, partial [Armatimonadota bacterium]